MQRLRIYTRYHSNSPVFFDICRIECEEYNKCQTKIENYRSDKIKKLKEFWKWCSLLDQIRSHLIKSVTFGTACLEAFIYDYAAHNFTDRYVKKYLDKLNLVSKWVVIPRLAIGKEFPRESNAFEYLIKLVKTRNDMLHSKSIPMPNFTDLEIAYGKKSLTAKELKKVAEETAKKGGPLYKKDVEMQKHFNCVSPYVSIIELLTELRKLEGDDEIGTQWWQLEPMSGSDRPIS